MGYRTSTYRTPALWMQWLGEIGSEGAKLGDPVEIRGRFRRTRDVRVGRGSRENVATASFETDDRWIDIAVDDVFDIRGERFRIGAIEERIVETTGHRDHLLMRLIPAGT